jgi:hypothetical protein
MFETEGMWKTNNAKNSFTAKRYGVACKVAWKHVIYMHAATVLAIYRGTPIYTVFILCSYAQKCTYENM